MASVYNYNFDNLTRIGDDTCGITAREAQNNEMGSYTTTNFFLKECGMKKPIAFATQQPSMFYNGGFGPCGAGGCNITSDSNDTKSCKTVTETSFSKYTRTPLLPTVQATIQNPHNLVEGVAAEGWIRGGLPSRELTRDQDYLERQTHSQ